MFGIGLPEMIVIMAVALIVVGPDKLPELARSLAKGIGELKKTMNQVKENLSEETKVISSVQEDLQKTAGQLTDNLLDETKIWRPEDDVTGAENNDAPDIIDLQPLEERPWERDANEEPVEKDREEEKGKREVEEEPAAVERVDPKADSDSGLAEETPDSSKKDNTSPAS